MGEFLGSPVKEKVSVEKENKIVKKILKSYVMLLVECKVGGRGWKMLS